MAPKKKSTKSKAKGESSILTINIRRVIITGIFIVLPLLITIFLISFLFQKVNQYVTPILVKILKLIPNFEALEPWIRPIIPILGLLIVLAFFFFIGLLGTHIIGRKIIGAFENLILQIPLVKGIYGSVKQFFEAIGSSSKKAFDEVVLVEYPRKGIWSLGLVTTNVGNKLISPDTDFSYVFIPTTPNPTSGLLIIVPREDLITLNLSVEEGIKLIVSGGMVEPDSLRSGERDTPARNLLE